jgi:tyrosyl-tRNA synthetase
MWKYIDVLSFDSNEAIAAKRAAVAAGENPRNIKLTFAAEIVDRFHGAGSGQLASEHFIARFQKGQLPDDIPEVTINIGDEGISLIQLLKQAELAPSTSEALRLIQQGAVKLDQVKCEDKALVLMPGHTVIIQVGKRRIARVTLV